MLDVKTNPYIFNIEAIIKRAFISNRSVRFIYDKYPNKVFVVKSVDEKPNTLVITIELNGIESSVYSKHDDFTIKSGRIIGISAEFGRFQIINEPKRLAIEKDSINALVDELVTNGELAFRKNNPDVDIDSVFLEGAEIKAEYGSKCKKVTNWWWPTEILFLCDNLLSRGVKYCSVQLARSPNSIRIKSYRLKISPTPEESAIIMNRYSDSELDYIDQNAQVLDLLEISEITGRSIPSLRIKCTEKNISRPIQKKDPATKKWTREEDDFLMNNVLEHGYRGVGYMLNRTYDSVHFRAKWLGFTIKALREKEAHRQRMLDVFPHG